MQIAVVGAGAIGLACAWRLCHLGEVVVIDASTRRTPLGAPQNASAAAAGMLAPYAEALLEPEDAHPGLGALGREALIFWRDDPMLSHLVKHKRCVTFVRPGEEERLAALLAVARRDGAAADWLGAEECKALGLRPGLAAARFQGEGRLDPRAALETLRARAADLGACFLEAEVIALEPGKIALRDGWVTRTLRADWIVLAPGVNWAPGLFEAAPCLRRVRALGGKIVEATTPASMTAARWDVLRGAEFYLYRSGPELHLGATMEEGAPAPGWSAPLSRLAVAALDALPVLAETISQARWLRGEIRTREGLRAFSPDWAPMIGPTNSARVLAACGHSRNGWLLAPITAEMIAAYIEERDFPPLWAGFHPQRFEKAS